MFDNDGTLWNEHPLYVQGMFLIDRVKELAPHHPEWREKQPFKAILERDLGALSQLSEHEVGALVAATHAGLTTDEFAQAVSDWLARTRHPRFGRLYTECTYQPMLEVLEFVRANGFSTWIVTGGGIDFVRVFAERIYDIPPHQVVGSSGKTRFEVRDERPVLIKLPELGSIDEGPGKPVNIHLHIGKRPILAFGNSDGDLQMLQYAAGGPHRQLQMVLHHDDPDREYAYDRDTKVGRLDQALQQAERNGWVVVSMKDEWKIVFSGR